MVFPKLNLQGGVGTLVEAMGRGIRTELNEWSFLSGGD